MPPPLKKKKKIMNHQHIYKGQLKSPENNFHLTNEYDTSPKEFLFASLTVAYQIL